MLTSMIGALSLLDAVGSLILATTFASLLAGIGAHVWLRARYAALEHDLEQQGHLRGRFVHPVLERVVSQAEAAARRSNEPNVQALVEDAFQEELKPLLLAERFVRAATGLVLVLGLLGTFYGLTLAIGRLVPLVSGDAGAVSDVGQAVSQGLTRALSGMAVAFSNSLVGVGSAVVLTVLGIVSNVTDRRVALMIRVETYVDRLFAPRAAAPTDPTAAVAAFGESVARLDGVMGRFESALDRLSVDVRDLRELRLVVALKPRGES